MNKLLVLLLVSLGLLNVSFSQQKDVDTLMYVPNTYIQDLLAENDSLQLIYEQTKHQLTNEQLAKIFTKTESNEYNIKQTQAALQLTAALGDNWFFGDTISPENRLNFKSMEEYLAFRNTLPISSDIIYDDNQSLKRQEITYTSGVKEIIEKDANGNYTKTTITKEGVKTVEKIKDISNYNTATMSVQRNND